MDQTDRFTWLEIRERLSAWSWERREGNERRIHRLCRLPVETPFDSCGGERGTRVGIHTYMHTHNEQKRAPISGTLKKKRLRASLVTLSLSFVLVLFYSQSMSVLLFGNVTNDERCAGFHVHFDTSVDYVSRKYMVRVVLNETRRK